MKRLSLAILMLLTLTWAQSAPQQAPASSALKTLAKVDLTKPAADPAANAAQARYVLQRTIAALGGDAYLQVTDVKQTGRGYGFYQNEPQGEGTVFTRYFRFPESERFEIQPHRDEMQFFKAVKWVIIHVGDRGWETTYKGTREQTAKDLEEYVRRRPYDIDTVLRGWLPDPKTSLFFEGQTIEATKQVYKVSLLNAKNQNVTVYVDLKTFLPVKKSFTYRDPRWKDIIEEADLYDKFRYEHGVMTPHVVTRMRNNEMVAQRFLQTVEFNTSLDERMFVPPPIDYDKMKKY